MWRLSTLILAVVVRIVPQIDAVVGPEFAQIGPFRINIANEGEYVAYAMTNFTDLGPQVGNILNAHYFPGLNLYRAGQYKDAYSQFVYVLDRPSYLDGNLNQGSYLGSAYYLRGMIFSYHATGTGRLSLAKADFENALKWNPTNYLPYLELSRLYSRLGFRDQAISMIQLLLNLQPDGNLAEDARNEMKRLMASPTVVKESPASSATKPNSQLP